MTLSDFEIFLTQIEARHKHKMPQAHKKLMADMTSISLLFSLPRTYYTSYVGLVLLQCFFVDATIVVVALEAIHTAIISYSPTLHYLQTSNTLKMRFS